MIEKEAVREQLRAMVSKAQRALKAAEAHLENGDSDFASSKAYYSVFHLLQAILLTKELTYSKHAGVISGFSEHFVKTGVFPASFGEQIAKLRRHRELGDYGYQLSVGSDEAESDIRTAREISDRLLNYLKPLIS